MTTAIVHHRRPLLPAINLLLASGAAVLALIAITADDGGSNTPTPASASPGVADASTNFLDKVAAFRKEVAAEDVCRRARANEPC